MTAIDGQLDGDILKIIVGDGAVTDHARYLSYEIGRQLDRLLSPNGVARRTQWEEMGPTRQANLASGDQPFKKLRNVFGRVVEALEALSDEERERFDAELWETGTYAVPGCDSVQTLIGTLDILDETIRPLRQKTHARRGRPQSKAKFVCVWIALQWREIRGDFPRPREIRKIFALGEDALGLGETAGASLSAITDARKIAKAAHARGVTISLASYASFETIQDELRTK